MNAHVILKLLNELKITDNYRLDEEIPLFLNLLTNFNNTGAQMLDSFYHITLK